MQTPNRIILIMLLLFSGIQLEAQNLWVGLNGGITAPINSDVERGEYFKGGVQHFSLLGGIEANFTFKSGLGLSLGRQENNYEIGVNSIKGKIYGLLTSPGAGILEIHDWRLGVNCNIELERRIYFSPEVAFHVFTQDEPTFGTGYYEFNDKQVNVETHTTITKPKFYPAASLRLSFDFRFSNGMIFRAGGRYLTGFSPIGNAEMIVTDGNGILIETYEYKIFPQFLQGFIGFHYPVSRIWKGKPW